MTEPHFIGYPFGTSKKRLCLSLWLIQDSNWKGRVLWRLSGGLATILQDWISCNEQKMREAHITRRETSFYLFMIFIEKISNRKLKHSLPIWERRPQDATGTFTWRLCHSTWLFFICFGNILKIYAFSPSFPLVGSVIGGFYWLFLWNFKEIKHQPFSMTQPYFFIFIYLFLKFQRDNQ